MTTWAEPRAFGRMFQTAVQLIYPPRCIGCGAQVESEFGLCGTCWRDTPFIGGTICERCGIPVHGPPDPEMIECDDCMTIARPWSRGRAALLYRDKARQIILGLKHGDRPEVVRPAALWLARAGRDLIVDNTLVVPVPLHRLRLFRRRFNQSALLARALASERSLGWCPDLLLRARATASQDGKSAAERFRNVEDAITVNAKRAPYAEGRPILLIDDVMTSGATLGACADACHAAGAIDVSVLVLARVAKED